MDPRIAAALEDAVTAGEIGVQVAAYVGATPIVDAWTGTADPRSGRDVNVHTLFPVFSVGKAITATALHLQAERGLVDYDEPVATYWPEFGCHGKERIKVWHAVTHQAGIPQMPAGVTPEALADWDWMTGQIATHVPWHPPGEQNSYHALVHGHILAEIVRRTDRKERSFAEFVRDELCTPLGIEDLYFGVPDEALPRVAHLTSELPPQRVVGESEISRAAKPDSIPPDAPVHNLRVVHQATYPGAGGIMSARGGVRVFAMLAGGGELDGVRLLSEYRVRSFTAPRPHFQRLDTVIMGGNVWAPPMGMGGYYLHESMFGSSPAALHHGGSGGSIGYADLDTGLSVMICHNRLFDMYTVEHSGTGRHPFAALVGAILAIAGETTGRR